MNEKSDRYPPQIRFIIGNEVCERFSFYGMRNILTIFLIQYLLASEIPDPATRQGAAKEVFHTFVMGVYFFPLLGGWLSDRFFGKYRTILWVSVLYCVGQFSLALSSGWKPGFYTGLILIALGSGGIKPCVSSFVGDQFDESNKHLVRGVFGLFYWIINFGSFFASLTIPLVLPAFGPTVAFGIPGVLMAIATVIFWLGRKRYVDLPPSGPNPHGVLRVVRSACRAWRSGRSRAAGFLDGALSEHPPEAVAALRAVLRVIPIFLLVSVFWSIFDQKASTVVIQGKQMVRTILGMTIQESQMQALNPLLVMILIPFHTAVLYPFLERRGLTPTPLRRMTAGIAFSGVAFAIVGVTQLVLDAGTSLHIAWQIAPYVVLTFAEVLVSTTGLEFAYSQAPLSMKGVIMSLWNLTVTLGNFLVVVVTAINFLPGAGQIFFFAALAGIAAVLFALVASRTNPVDHFRPSEAKGA